MSVKLMSAIFETEFRDLQDASGNATKAATAKLVLLALADHANDEGESAYPSIERLSKKTALSPQTIRNTFDALKYNGIVFLAGTSKYMTNNYTINTESFPRLLGNTDDFPPLQLIYPSNQSPNPSNQSLTPLYPLDPNHHLTINKQPALSPKDINNANAMVDSIIANSAKGTWLSRETFLSQDLPLADWWNKTTNQPINKTQVTALRKACAAWRGLSIASLQEAYDIRKGWAKVVSNPNEITSAAAAIEAAGMNTAATKKPVTIDETGKPETY